MACKSCGKKKCSCGGEAREKKAVGGMMGSPGMGAPSGVSMKQPGMGRPGMGRSPVGMTRPGFPSKKPGMVADPRTIRSTMMKKGGAVKKTVSKKKK